MPLSAEMGHLTDGDVVYLNPPAGTLSVLYRRHSPHNTIVATEKCNCRCIMCPQPPREDAEDGWVEVCLEAIRLMSRETVALGISGGEPTMAPEGLLEIVRVCRECLPETALQVLTNARMFNYLGYAREMAAIDHADLIFGVPVYSDLAHEHDRIVGAGSAFDQTVRGIMNLRRCGQRVEIRVVVMRQNFERLADLARFIARNLPFAEHVALMGMEPVGLARRNFKRLWVDPADYQAELGAAVGELRRHGIAVSLFNEQLCILHPSLRDVAARSISDWKNVFVDECRGCAARSECGGFFESSRELHSRAIRAL
jgi:His-Xaa-Ser system radical SAM maturase HxsC